MKGRILSWFVGSLKITIRGYCCERFFNLCAYHGIVLWKLKPLGENEFTAGISLKNFSEKSVPWLKSAMCGYRL